MTQNLSNLWAVVATAYLAACLAIDLRRGLYRIVMGRTVVLVSVFIWYLLEAIRLPNNLGRFDDGALAAQSQKEARPDPQLAVGFRWREVGSLRRGTGALRRRMVRTGEFAMPRLPKVRLEDRRQSAHSIRAYGRSNGALRRWTRDLYERRARGQGPQRLCGSRLSLGTPLCSQRRPICRCARLTWVNRDAKRRAPNRRHLFLSDEFSCLLPRTDVGQQCLPSPRTLENGFRRGLPSPPEIGRVANALQCRLPLLSDQIQVPR